MKGNYQPFSLGSQFNILPPNAPSRQEERTDIYMERGAFGSGEHETTESCLEILGGVPLKEQARILDLGSGTGILSIAALLLGGGHAWCVDIEQAAVESCQRNCQLNGLETQVTHICGTLEKLQESNFDLLLANIYGDILLMVAEELVSKAVAGADILLSGILWEYNFDVRQKYLNLGCEVLENRMLQEFSTLLLRKT